MYMFDSSWEECQRRSHMNIKISYYYILIKKIVIIVVVIELFIGIFTSMMVKSFGKVWNVLFACIAVVVPVESISAG